MVKLNLAAAAAAQAAERPAIEWQGVEYAVRVPQQDYSPQIFEDLQAASSVLATVAEQGPEDDPTPYLQSMMKMTQCIMFDPFPEDVLANFTQTEFHIIWEWYVAQYPQFQVNIAAAPTPPRRRRGRK